MGLFEKVFGGKKADGGDKLTNIEQDPQFQLSQMDERIRTINRQVKQREEEAKDSGVISIELGRLRNQLSELNAARNLLWEKLNQDGL